MLYLIPKYGLCNRMRAIDSILALKKEYNIPVIILWEVNGELFSPFENLFEPIDNLIIKNVSLSNIYKLIRHFELLKQQNPENNQLLFLGEQTVKASLSSINSQIVYAIQKGKYVIMETFNRFHSTPSPYTAFKLTKELQEKVNNQVKKFSPDTIGVHIRRTDNEKSILYSPTELFIEAIEKEIDKNPEVNFYLASDDMQVKEELTKEFGHRIITQWKPVSRTTLEGIQDAAVELYTLSHTSKIFGSYWSSFSETAAAISGIPHFVIKNND